MRWMNLEPIIQNEVSRKKKDKYRILMHTYEIQKGSTDDCICKAAMEKQRDRPMGMERGGESERYGKNNMEIYYHM